LESESVGRVSTIEEEIGFELISVVDVMNLSNERGIADQPYSDVGEVDIMAECEWLATTDELLSIAS
jgi:hypothetical protein